MSSGNGLFELFPHDSVQPPANYATQDVIVDASSEALVIPTLDFDGATNEHADWYFIIPSQYSGTTGFTFRYYYATDGSNANLVELEFRVLHLDDLDILTSDLGIDTQTPVSIQDTPPATPTNKLSYSTTGALAKASFGSAIAGDLIVIRCTRDTAAASNTDDFQLAAVYITET